jgi:hypothetical protein
MVRAPPRLDNSERTPKRRAAWNAPEMAGCDSSHSGREWSVSGKGVAGGGKIWFGQGAP